jgi:hypothetical protein
MSEAELAVMVPPFDPAEVKMGNLKDPDKNAAKLAHALPNPRGEVINAGRQLLPEAGAKRTL